MNVARRIELKLLSDLMATEVEVGDESALHVGHAGALDGGGHFRITVVSPLFSGKTPLQRHRLVYDTLMTEDMSGSIHALSMTTLAPDEN